MGLCLAGTFPVVEENKGPIEEPHINTVTNQITAGKAYIGWTFSNQFNI